MFKHQQVCVNTRYVSVLYFYNNDVIKYAKQLSPSERGELEITDINNRFLKNNKLKLIILEKEVSWIDTGTFGALIKASKFFQELESKTRKSSDVTNPASQAHISSVENKLG